MTDPTNIPDTAGEAAKPPGKKGHERAARPANADPDLELLTRERLIARWRGHGSDAFFWRAARAGTLVPQRSGGLVRYAWPDVLDFEGGPAPEGLEAAYRRDLLTPQDVARLCACAPGWIDRHVRTGKLPVRRVGRFPLFVGAEVAAWQETSWKRAR